MSRKLFMNALSQGVGYNPACGSATSIVTMDLMDKTGVYFPEAHLAPGKNSFGRAGKGRH